MRVLVVDDELGVRRALRRVLGSMDFTVEEAENGEEAIGRLQRESFDLTITDLRMPLADGFEVLAAARRTAPAMPVLMLTAHGTVKDCVEAMRAGATDFIAKPFDNEELKRIVREALAGARASETPSEWAPPAARPAIESRAAIISNSPAMARVVELVERVANTDATVLLSGESGTGKEVVARLVHGGSARGGNRFVAVNCGAIPEGLIESELFGHAKGAFTGATDRRIGRFVEADRGTLFLDEIGELPPAMQVRLLRVLQDREVHPVGGGAPQAVDIRIIAATNRDLDGMVKNGTFRGDLFYRLNVMPIELPPLRDRGDDVCLLATHFLEVARERSGRKITFAEDALAALKLHAWPGNVRELLNLVERLVILDRDGVITLDDLPSGFMEGAARAVAGAHALHVPDAGIDLPETLLQVERNLVEEAMRKADGNKTRAADLLGINRTTLIEKLKRLARESR